MTPTQKDILRLKEILPQFRGLRHNYLYNKNWNLRQKQNTAKRLNSLKSRIETLLSNINSRFFNSRILEITYIDEHTGNRYRVSVTDVLEQDIRDYFAMLEYFKGIKLTILEIKEIQDRINPLPL